MQPWLGDDDRIPANVAASPGDLALCAQRDAMRLGTSLWQPRRPGKLHFRTVGVGFSLGEFLARDTSDEPRSATKPVMQLLVYLVRMRAARRPAFGQDPAVDAAGHVTDDMRLHVRESGN